MAGPLCSIVRVSPATVMRCNDDSAQVLICEIMLGKNLPSLLSTLDVSSAGVLVPRGGRPSDERFRLVSRCGEE